MNLPLHDSYIEHLFLKILEGIHIKLFFRSISPSFLTQISHSQTMGNIIGSRPGNRLAIVVGNRARRIMGNRVRDLMGERRENLTVFAKTSPIKATAKLVIKNFEEVMKGSNPGVKYDSNTFLVGDTPMAMTVYPNGFLQDDRGYVSVYLCNNSTADIPVKCQFSCDAGSLSLDDKVLASQALGSRRFLSHAE